MQGQQDWILTWLLGMLHSQLNIHEGLICQESGLLCCSKQLSRH